MSAIEVPIEAVFLHPTDEVSGGEELRDGLSDMLVVGIGIGGLARHLADTPNHSHHPEVVLPLDLETRALFTGRGSRVVSL